MEWICHMQYVKHIGNKGFTCCTFSIFFAPISMTCSTSQLGHHQRNKINYQSLKNTFDGVDLSHAICQTYWQQTFHMLHLLNIFCSTSQLVHHERNKTNYQSLKTAFVLVLSRHQRYHLWYINPCITANIQYPGDSQGSPDLTTTTTTISIIDVVSDYRLQWIYYNKLLTTMHTGQFYGRMKKTLPPNRIIVPSEESDDDMVDSSDSEMDISIDSDSDSVEESFISEEGKGKK